MHNVIGVTPPYDGYVAYKWIITWLIVCGGSCVASLFAPTWVKMPEPKEHQAEH